MPLSFPTLQTRCKSIVCLIVLLMIEEWSCHVLKDNILVSYVEYEGHSTVVLVETHPK